MRWACNETHLGRVSARGFVDTLELAREMKLIRLGTVCIDGMQIRASASKDKNLTYERTPKLHMLLRLDVDALLQQAEQHRPPGRRPAKGPPREIARPRLQSQMPAHLLRPPPTASLTRGPDPTRSAVPNRRHTWTNSGAETEKNSPAPCRPLIKVRQAPGTCAVDRPQ